MTARKLRPYFLSHPIVVLNNSPLGRIMTHAEVSGRMIKWTIELGEYDIEYKHRVAKKAQVLTDFLIEMIQPREEEVWRVFVDGALNLSRCGVGVVLIAPSGEKIKLALRIDSRVTNNEAEYEAVLTGLQATREVGASRIPIEENEEPDTLAKLAASMSDTSTREVMCLTRLVLSVDEEVPPTRKSSWMTPLIEYMVHAKLPEDKAQALKIKKQAPMFVLLNDVLYRRSYQGPLLKCLSENEVEYVFREIYEGCCGEHLGETALSRKAILAGFWWPRMHQDATQLVQKCKGCQYHFNFHHRPAAGMQPISASCPFDQWGLDIVGPFPIARAQKKFLLVVVDYFSKWVEVEPLAKITKEEVMKFLWKNIVCRYGIPRKLISDNGRQFQGKKITSWCQEMKSFNPSPQWPTPKPTAKLK
ncbi:uncharacterized protein LOC142538445 [Primulina tabacum]|uniref:uncharacterized protein LOC142538445 n=1 Tax=Primulina tabacum TaxID=48773 RepID=UPI003F59B2DA